MQTEAVESTQPNIIPCILLQP